MTLTRRYWAILQRLERLQIDKKQRKALREEFGRFYFWGDGYYPYEGRLDEILLSSSRLRRRVLSVMVEVALLICSDKNSQYISSGIPRSSYLECMLNSLDSERPTVSYSESLRFHRRL